MYNCISIQIHTYLSLIQPPLIVACHPMKIGHASCQDLKKKVLSAVYIYAWLIWRKPIAGLTPMWTEFDPLEESVHPTKKNNTTQKPCFSVVVDLFILLSLFCECIYCDLAFPQYAWSHQSSPCVVSLLPYVLLKLDLVISSSDGMEWRTTMRWYIGKNRLSINYPPVLKHGVLENPQFS